MNALSHLHGCAAPAKLNVFLHVTGRRADGYHLLQTVFVLIDWCDHLDFALRADGCISRSQSGGAPLPADDLCVRAAQALQQASACALGAHIHVHKRIPAQAGLGGGSSDAATCLLALNRLWGLHLPRQRLMEMGLTLGADVPFFLFGRTAWAQGVGEELREVALPAQQVLVIKPAAGLATRDIFTAPDLPRHTPAVRQADFEAAADPWFFGHNDLQGVAQRLCPDITQAQQWCAAQGLHARMSGSGSAVFAPWPNARNPNLLPPPPFACEMRCCHSLNTHPLLQCAA